MQALPLQALLLRALVFLPLPAQGIAFAGIALASIAFAGTATTGTALTSICFDRLIDYFVLARQKETHIRIRRLQATWTSGVSVPALPSVCTGEAGCLR